ncbi:xanthine dehydrogenase family protein molybdopterin-binding subunit [Candidatus Acetothermia bacterium]|nr:xanthine dehydrogenase family protein molybdopterin-binding subunit [Candidatus Acetothermia bacterium]
MAQKLVGQRVKRVEDPRLITGTSHYVDDIHLPGMLYAAFLRSPYAHARIKSIKADLALQHPGVVAVITGKETKDKCGTVPCAAAVPDLKRPTHYCLALDRAYFVGHPVAIVIANDRYTARDAVDLIDVDFEPLPAASDPEAALKSGAPLAHPEFRTNLAFKTEGADIPEIFKKADKIVKQKLLNQRLVPCAMEPRGVIAHWLPGEQQLTLWSSTQIPHLMRTQVALMLGFPENRLRVITPEVGGGFGSKLNVYAEESLLGYVSMKLKKPVKWIETRRENFTGTIHGRGQVAEIEMAVKNDGTILGMKYHIVSDLGAYHQLLTPAMPILTGLVLTGSYKIPSVSLSVSGVFTNRMSTDAYRGAGRPEATYMIERMMDRIAQELKLDPVEVRKKNFPKPEEFPFATPMGVVYDSGNYTLALDKCLELIGYQKFRQEQAEARKQGRHIGIGLSCYVEICALGPSPAMPAGGWESATVRLEPTGKVTILTGASPHGQGQETSFAQIAADELGVKLEDIIVVHGDTSIVQYGIGTFGSRATAVGGTAVYEAINKLKAKGKKIAAHNLGVEENAVEWDGGGFAAKGQGKRLSIGEIALAAHLAKMLPQDMEPGLSATHFYEPKNFTFPFGAHAVTVEVDIETGAFKILRYVAVDDCGKVINPMMVDGQIHGGIAQGLGQALYEEAVYDENGQLLTGEFMDYALPRTTHMPWIECDRTETPTPVNPLGVKGVGEAGTIGSTPVFVNAVVDALAPFGIKHIDMPLKPEKIWRAIQAAKRA